MTNYRKIKRVFPACPLGKNEYLLQGLGAEVAAGSDWLGVLRQPMGPRQRLELNKCTEMSCKHHWSSPLRHPQPLPRELPR